MYCKSIKYRNSIIPQLKRVKKFVKRLILQWSYEIGIHIHREDFPQRFIPSTRFFYRPDVPNSSLEGVAHRRAIKRR